MQRYSIGISRNDNDSIKLMGTFCTEEPDDDGLYIRYTDHLIAMQKKDITIALIQGAYERERLRSHSYERDIDRRVKECLELATEIERLRAALKKGDTFNCLY